MKNYEFYTKEDILKEEENESYKFYDEHGDKDDSLKQIQSYYSEVLKNINL